ncbi:MAG: polyprenyl synthetase family protein [Defluviitaleaceae bacterium]|nr:polyprenyl synthetase family protein [Defluviitaleaceae bacterium]
MSHEITFDEGVALTDKVVNEKLTGLANSLKAVTAYIAKAKGKGVRTSLLLLSAMQKNGLISPNAPVAAASVEILHMATLIHDDVIDNSPIRRGVQTVHEKFGTKEAVISGDYLLCMSMNLVFDLLENNNERYANLTRVLTKAISRICIGEYEQMLQNGNLDIDVPKYLKIIHGKTAALFYAAAHFGAIFSDCCDEDIKRVSAFGRYLGVIFQIMDDCKDYQLTQDEAKKPVKSDASAGVITLPLIFAMQKNIELKNLANEVMLNKVDGLLLAREVIEIGGVRDAKSLALRYKRKAAKTISAIKNETKKDALLRVLNDIEI